MYLANYAPEFKLRLPISGLASNIKKGAYVGKNTTPSTDNGHLELFSGFSAQPNAVGFLNEPHTASGNDVDVAGTTYNEPGRNGITASDPTKLSVHPVEFLQPLRLVRCDFSLASADLITCTQAVSTTTMTVTNLENNIQCAFIYVASGTGAGQMNYVASQSGGGAVTLKAGFGTNLDTTSKFVKILPRFHKLLGFTSDGTKLASQAAAGAVKGVIWELYWILNGYEQRLNPQLDSALTGLSSAPTFRLQADITIADTLMYTTT